jgi:hypothetical protein
MTEDTKDPKSLYIFGLMVLSYYLIIIAWSHVYLEQYFPEPHVYCGGYMLACITTPEGFAHAFATIFLSGFIFISSSLIIFFILLSIYVLLSKIYKTLVSIYK